MNIWDVLLGRAPSLEQAEEDLGKPEEAEATDLNLHVERCAKRWAMSYRASKQNHAQLAQLRIFMVLLMVILAATSDPGAKIVAKFIGP